jgi:hypothetical protein
MSVVNRRASGSSARGSKSTANSGLPWPIPSRAADAERAVIRIVRRQAIRLATVFSQVWREPGGNVTGSSLQLNDTAGKRLELLA